MKNNILQEYFMRLLSDESPRIAHMMLQSMSMREKESLQEILESGKQVQPIFDNEIFCIPKFLVYINVESNWTSASKNTIKFLTKV